MHGMSTAASACAFQWLANREREDGTLTFLNHERATGSCFHLGYGDSGAEDTLSRLVTSLVAREI